MPREEFIAVWTNPLVFSTARSLLLHAVIVLISPFNSGQDGKLVFYSPFPLSSFPPDRSVVDYASHGTRSGVSAYMVSSLESSMYSVVCAPIWLYRTCQTMCAGLLFLIRTYLLSQDL